MNEKVDKEMTISDELENVKNKITQRPADESFEYELPDLGLCHSINRIRKLKAEINRLSDRLSGLNCDLEDDILEDDIQGVVDDLENIGGEL